MIMTMMMMMMQIKAECLGCRQNAAIFNMSYFGKFYLTGPDAQAATNFIFTNNVDLNPGKSISVSIVDLYRYNRQACNLAVYASKMIVEKF